MKCHCHSCGCEYDTTHAGVHDTCDECRWLDSAARGLTASPWRSVFENDCERQKAAADLAARQIRQSNGWTAKRVQAMTDLRLTTGERIRVLRMRTGHLRQSDLAARCGVSLSTIQRIEDGRSAPTTDLLARIAGVLGVPVAMLLPAQSGAGGDQ